MDIVYEALPTFAANPMQYEVAYPMDDLVRAHRVDLSRVEPTIIQAVREMSDGKLTAFPTLTNTLAMYYNKDLFEKFGVAYPKDNMTWDDIIEMNRQLTRLEDGQQYVGLSMSVSHAQLMSPLSLQRYNHSSQKAEINNDKWRTFFQSLIDVANTSGYKEKMGELGAFPPLASFLERKEAAMYGGPANTHSSSDFSNLNWDMVTFPMYKQAMGVQPQSYPTMFGIADSSKQKDAAMEVMGYMLSDEFQMSISRKGFIPIVNSPAVQAVFSENATQFADKNVKSVLYSNSAPLVVPSIYDNMVPYLNYVNDIVLGNIDLNTALREIEEEANLAIAAVKGQ